MWSEIGFRLLVTALYGLVCFNAGHDSSFHPLMPEIPVHTQLRLRGIEQSTPEKTPISTFYPF